MHQVYESRSVQPLVAQLLSTQNIQARQQHPALQKGQSLRMSFEVASAKRNY
jgi:hypothetical protein